MALRLMCEDLSFISVFSVLKISCHAIWLSSKTWHQQLQEVRGEAGVHTTMDSTNYLPITDEGSEDFKAKIGRIKATCFKLPNVLPTETRFGASSIAR